MLESAIQQYIDAEPPIDLVGLDPAVIRELLAQQIDRQFRRFGRPGPDVLSVNDHVVPVEGGQIVLRLYRPGAGRLPAHLLVHGGGWTSGSIDELVCDATARTRAVAVGCVVAALEYRLAPEFPFPAAVYDTVAALRWLQSEAVELGIDATDISVGGASAGANLLVAALLAAPDIAVVGAVLEVPALDLTVESVRKAISEQDFPVSVEELLVAPRLYLRSPGDALLPMASPFLADDLSWLPPTQILTAELDPLRREGELFAERLRAAGVPAEATRYRGAVHGSAILTRSWPTARRWNDDIIVGLRVMHHREPPTADGSSAEGRDGRSSVSAPELGAPGTAEAVDRGRT
ncbi:acetyl esterase [Nakamurella sp. UYEF19]|uniref:alpha/beta hydrolase n=1 Tax=Nakamurella sp. UYEF19 TaxID=1756392 RepID=UPI0033965E91